MIKVSHDIITFKAAVMPAILMLWLFCAHGTAYAVTATVSTQVLAQMVGSCTVSALPMNFVAYDGVADVTTSSTITTNCTSGVAYMIHLDAGSHYTATSRHVADIALNLIAYQLYQGATAIPWGDAGNAGGATTPWPSLPQTGTGLNQVSTVTGILFGGTNAPAGNYSDVINITVTY